MANASPIIPCAMPAYIPCSRRAKVHVGERCGEVCGSADVLASFKSDEGKHFGFLVSRNGERVKGDGQEKIIYRQVIRTNCTLWVHI